MVTTREDMAVVGYIRRQILQRMIDVALEEEAVRPDTPCIFSRRSRTCPRLSTQARGRAWAAWRDGCLPVPRAGGRLLMEPLRLA